VLVGLVSDSHGLADPALPALLDGCDLVLHAGDVVTAAVLEALKGIAPVKAVRGNNDVAPVVGDLPEVRLVTLGALTAYLVHDVGSPGRPHPSVGKAIRRLRPALVIHGHSHRPGTALVDGVLFVNPGSAGPRRFSLPRTAGRLTVVGRRVKVELFVLGEARPTLLGAPLELELS